jgi:hypothetical protein
MASKVRRLSRVVCAVAVVLFVAAPGPIEAASASPDLHADLDGTAIALVDVGKYYCEDFTAPAIHCFTKASALESSIKTLGLAAASGNYLIVYDYTGYAGAYMYVAQDYTVLATIGWNDRISSYVALNGEYGHFFTDWFYSGTSYAFCCNQLVPALGAYDNSFSSVHRL